MDIYNEHGFIYQRRNEHCSRHGGYCCYAESDPDRCPDCHVLWSVIRAGERHFCEPEALTPGQLRGLQAARKSRAARRRH